MNGNTICLLGDSVAKGVVYDPERSRYVFEKESLAHLLEEDGHWEVNNLSRFGCTITKGQQIAERNLERVRSADWILTEFGGNDSDHSWVEIADNPAGEHSANTPLEEFCRRYRALLRDLLQLGSRVAVMNLPPIEPEKFFSWFCGKLNTEAVMTWLGGSIDVIYRWHEMYNDAVSRLAAEFSVPVIDIRSAFLQTDNYSSLLCQDGIHPNRAGHRLLYRQVASFLLHA